MRIVLFILLLSFGLIQSLGANLNASTLNDHLNDDENIVFVVNLDDSEETLNADFHFQLAGFQGCQLTQFHVVPKPNCKFFISSFNAVDQFFVIVSSDTSPPYFQLN